MEREERSERFTARDMAKARREVNKDSIVFILLLNIGQKVVSGFSELQVFEYLPSSSFFIFFRV